tara:strand:+ start:3397 stop:5037 length:1641 start_codon:yes stop_codon:yes gene_type:complete
MKLLNNFVTDLKNLLSKYSINEEVEIRISGLEDFDFQINNLIKHEKNKDIDGIRAGVSELLKNEHVIDSYEITEKNFININISLKSFFETINDLEINLQTNNNKIIIDYGGPNIGKPLHVGHLRSLNIGRSLYEINKIAGNSVVSDIHLGDWGMPISQILTYCEINDMSPHDLDINELVEIYPQASSLYETSKTFSEKALNINKLLNNNDVNYINQWKAIKKISIYSIKETLNKLGHDFDLWLGESDVNKLIPSMLNDLKEKNKISEDDGALISNQDTDPKILITKSDGSYLYLTTDLATILNRIDGTDFDKILYVVDGRQSLHFKQLFMSAEYFEFENKKYEHISFGTINDNEGRPLKTREGGTKSLNELYEETFKYLRTINKNLSESDTDKLVNTVVTYSDLITNRKTDYKFDLERFTSFNGKTGIYVQYALVRAKKLLLNSNLDINNLKIEIEKLDVNDTNLIRGLFKFESYFEQALKNSEPHHLAEYLYEISNLFNSVYQNENIIKNVDEVIKVNKLIITSYFIKYSELLFRSLGLTTVEKM